MSSDCQRPIGPRAIGICAIELAINGALLGVNPPVGIIGQRSAYQPRAVEAVCLKLRVVNRRHVHAVPASDLLLSHARYLMDH